jgi:hypothetical protein
MPVILSKVHGIVLDLRLVQPLESLHAAGTIRLLSSKARLDDSLGNEGNIPQLTSVRPGHHHAFLPKPHEIGPPSSMFLEGDALGTINVPPNYEVHHLADRAQVLKIGVVVLGEYEVINPLESSATKWRERTILVLAEDDI